MTTFLLALLIARIAAPTSTWTAQNTAGRAVPVTQSVGDVVTLAIPTPSDRPAAVAFLVEPIALNLNGRVITATFHFTTTGTPAYIAGYTGGCPTPPNFRLYFTSTTGTYSVTQASHNPAQYWWARNASATIASVDDGVEVTLYAVVAPEQWSDANGQGGETIPTAFQSAAANARQIGFSFGGGCFYDTGIQCTSGASTLHVTGYTVQ